MINKDIVQFVSTCEANVFLYQVWLLTSIMIQNFISQSTENNFIVVFLFLAALLFPWAFEFLVLCLP